MTEMTIVGSEFDRGFPKKVLFSEIEFDLKTVIHDCCSNRAIYENKNNGKLFLTKDGENFKFGSHPKMVI